MGERDILNNVTSIEVGRRRRDERTDPRVPGLKEALEDIYLTSDPSDQEVAKFVKDVKRVQRRTLPQRVIRKLYSFKK